MGDAVCKGHLEVVKIEVDIEPTEGFEEETVWVGRGYGRPSEIGEEHIKPKLGEDGAQDDGKGDHEDADEEGGSGRVLEVGEEHAEADDGEDCAQGDEGRVHGLRSPINRRGGREDQSDLSCPAVEPEGSEEDDQNGKSRHAVTIESALLVKYLGVRLALSL